MCATLNKGIALHRLMNQRRIAFSLLSRIQTLLEPGMVFPRELNQLFRQQGKFGSRDRRLYRELVYTYLRYQPWLEPMKRNESAFLDALIALATPTPEILSLYPSLGIDAPDPKDPESRYRLIGKSHADLADLLPEWFASHASQPLDEDDLKTLFSRPPLWLRLQKGDIKAVIEQLRRLSPPDTAPPQGVWGIPDAIRCPADLPIDKTPLYQSGQVEIQDISSQLLLQLVHPQPEGNWLDACAGAGGKSLQLAEMLGSQGRLTAYDPRSDALDALEARARRAGLENIAISRKPPNSGGFDGVLVDAPCSGSGTWRRHPYLLRQIREADIHSRSQVQRDILDFYASRVAPNGTLVYITCSLSRFENEAVAASFLKNHPSFEQQPLAKDFGLEEKGLGITILPKAFDGDGLYVATFKRKF